MQEIAAYLLLKLGGKNGSAEEISSVIQAGGGTANDEHIATLLKDLEGKDINELLKSGMAKLKGVPMGGGGGGGGGAAGGGTNDASGAAVEEKEEEKEEEEEMDLGGGMDMFGGGDAGGGGDY